MEKDATKIPVIFDSDANNELDDQHALAYLLFNGETFDVRGVTVNATYNGGDIEGHYAEAERVMKLCGVSEDIPLYTGANGSFKEIRPSIDQSEFDGNEAVDFIIRESRKERTNKLVLLPVGKLTNIALALEKAPDIKDKIRIVWLGSNYPEPGEYNQDNDIPSLNYILEQDVLFEMVMVRYGKSSGSDAVKVTPKDIEKNMPGTGPKVTPIEGRHGNSFKHFGDYSLDLFNHAEMYGEPPSRALFDMVAVAIIKNPAWGESKEIPAPILIDKDWIERPENKNKVGIWENFDKQSILKDFFEVMKKPIIAKSE
ncbi:MAG: nucleoside hydrolase [Reichenbachiella sp.]